MAMFAQSIWANIGGSLILISLIIFAEFCVLFRALTMDLNECFKRFNESVISVQVNANRTNRLKMIAELKDMILFHADIKQ